MNLLGVGNLIESPREKQTHPKITKENVNDLFKGQSHASWFAERNDLESLRELFETFQCTRLEVRMEVRYVVFERSIRARVTSSLMHSFVSLTHITTGTP